MAWAGQRDDRHDDSRPRGSPSGPVASRTGICMSIRTQWKGLAGVAGLQPPSRRRPDRSRPLRRWRRRCLRRKAMRRWLSGPSSARALGRKGEFSRFRLWRVFGFDADASSVASRIRMPAKEPVSTTIGRSCLFRDRSRRRCRRRAFWARRPADVKPSPVPPNRLVHGGVGLREGLKIAVRAAASCLRPCRSRRRRCADWSFRSSPSCERRDGRRRCA